ncbi:MAG: winged helix-turn-helix domain-containing protein [Acidobacteria bacterium]|nr:winged helix-turn-helix domain-containing protein [Acidobacteriota bacterium]MBS1866676.1 winged helix-turn-helix domain-containing protein [Acidobacteriota bacterium]
MAAIPPNLPSSPNVCFGPFVLDPSSGELRKSGTLIKLQPQPFRLLLLLAESAGTVVTREEIQRCLWTDSTFVDFDHGINFSINQIRTALADDAEKPRFVETLPRRGYRFIAEVRLSSNGHATAKTAVSVPDPAPAPLIAPDRRCPRETLPHSVVSIRPDLDLPATGTKSAVHFTRKQIAVTTVIVLVLSVLGFRFVNRTPAPKDWKLRQLTTNPPENSVTSGSLSRDGKYLAYIDVAGIHVKLLETGETSLIPPPVSLNGVPVEWRIAQQWFPDSTRFLADSHPSGQSPAFWSSQGSSIWVISVLGGPPRKLRDDAVADAISPDGLSIAFATNKGRLGDREIWLMGPDGENARKFMETDDDGSISAFGWFPNGQRVAYGANHFADGGLVTRDTNGGPATPVFPPSESKKIWQYLLLPDDRILYPQAEPGTAGQTCNLWSMAVDPRTGVAAGNPRRLTNWAGFCPLDPSVTADGRKLSFVRWTGHSSISVADLESPQIRIVNSRPFSPSQGQDTPLDWTRDSKNIIFSSNRNGHKGIFIQPFSGGAAEPLVSGPYDWADARVSPDGSWLLYVADNDKDFKSGTHIMRVPLTGGTSQPVLTGRAYSEFRCARAPSSLCVLAERTDDRTHFVFTAFDAFAGRGAELARIPIYSESKKFHWDLSSDGSRIGYAVTPDDPIEILSLRSNSTQTVRVKGWDQLNSLDWTASGDGFFVESSVHGGSVLLHVNLQGNAIVLQKGPGNAAGFARSSPDGRHLAMHYFGIEGNIWSLENF